MSKSNNKVSWVTGVRHELTQKPPLGWVVLKVIAGRGVQLCPNDCAYLTRNQSGIELQLVGTHKIVFEFFRLNSGKLKLSARVSGIEGSPVYHEFYGIARSLGCPLPERKGKPKSSQSVAVWPPEESRHSCVANDYVGMAEWVRNFLSAPPSDLTLFVAASRNLLVSKGRAK
jgi:hypothetical protein